MSHLCALAIEVVVADDGDVQSPAECVLQRAAAENSEDFCDLLVYTQARARVRGSTLLDSVDGPTSMIQPFQVNVTYRMHRD